jgi:predicted XRE-type DNA-binding protein
MIDPFSKTDFRAWMKAMDITQEKAASLLKVPVPCIDKYAKGKLSVPPKHSILCRKLLALKTEGREI